MPLRKSALIFHLHRAPRSPQRERLVAHAAFPAQTAYRGVGYQVVREVHGLGAVGFLF